MNISHRSLLKSRPVLGLTAVLFTFASVTEIASAAATIKILRSADQQITYGAAFPDALMVWVTVPVTERAVTGLTVDFVAGAGIGLTSTYAVTDECGLASVSAGGLAAADSEVSAENWGIPGAKVTFHDLVLNKTPLGLGSLSNGPTSGDWNAMEAAVIEPLAIEGESRVHTAFLGQLENPTMAQPNFIAGLRGESGVFVRAAIWLNPVASAPYRQSLPAQTAIENLPLANMTALPTFAAGMQIGADAPVHPVVLPQIVTASNLQKSSGPRSAIPAVISDLRRVTNVPVRAAFVSKSSTVSAVVQYSNSGPGIRKAFNPPGSE